jgi:hypothetical protein
VVSNTLAAGYSVVNKYAAHGIGRRFHAPPHIQHGGGLPRQVAVGTFHDIQSRTRVMGWHFSRYFAVKAPFN